ncbi:MAG: hypothetical protein COV30_01505 [Candidatus Yanofskybacteria bacterium CG10_big_fil_rev_8_21_14_0_10_37_15]|uniref:HTH HARE-type domain-containing protein n=1 Tax=Candidatus Yanofskybacteria bacterium CG10_big_fil_rev_8_21_14_0_10_37_15 TaxID=1975097 RepID=A0A2H0R5P7_9BACT|nr:MAG: hypothetical protein COV30_01505 [Candidatus Yanofskybacteria bacterium CG10_big_fil_rev_8_21_14_0_10_37_15]
MNSANAIVKTATNLINNIPARNRDILSRRFGLKSGKKETLESIGKSYGITRERVRQIEEFSINQLRKVSDKNQDVEKYVALVKNIIGDNGVIREEELFKSFSGREADSAINFSLVFVLSMNRNLIRFPESDDFYSFWAVSPETLTNFKSTSGSLVDFLEKNKRAVSEDDFVSLIESRGLNNLSGKLDICLSISKNIGKNIFNEIGLVSWPEIKPKGVRDKAFLVLKKSKNPEHFGDITKLINTSGFQGKKANTQTVHNELIKDPRFILVGRGTYALSEWGYKSGTVKDVLVDLIKDSSKSVPKATLISKVLSSRMVKENTILLNLQDSKTFIKNEDGTYSLRKS